MTRAFSNIFHHLNVQSPFLLSDLSLEHSVENRVGVTFYSGLWAVGSLAVTETGNQRIVSWCLESPLDTAKACLVSCLATKCRQEDKWLWKAGFSSCVVMEGISRHTVQSSMLSAVTLLILLGMVSGMRHILLPCCAHLVCKFPWDDKIPRDSSSSGLHWRLSELSLQHPFKFFYNGQTQQCLGVHGKDRTQCFVHVRHVILRHNADFSAFKVKSYYFNR